MTSSPRPRTPWLLLTCITTAAGCGAGSPSSTDGPVGASGGGSTGTQTMGAGGSGGGATGTQTMGAGGSGGAGGATPDARAPGSGGTSGGTTGSPTCATPAYVLPLNPSNPQDGITLGGFYVDTDTWNAAGYRVSQTMYVCDYDDWYVVANMNDDAHDGAVKTYPNVHKDFSGAPKISSFATIASSFAHVAPHVGIYELAYDIWLNGVASSGSTEVMIWTDNYHQTPSGSRLDTVSFGGRSYDVYKSGSYIAFVDTANASSGTLDLLSFFNYVIGKGWIPATSTVGAIDYGVELVSTGGTDAVFAVTGFSLTAQ